MTQKKLLLENGRKKLQIKRSPVSELGAENKTYFQT